MFERLFVPARLIVLLLTLPLPSPCSEHGVVTDWHDMEHIWQSVYKEMEIAPEDVRRLHV